MKVISDSSPLIGLSSIGQLNILKSLWNNIIIPEAVYNEVVILGKDKKGSTEVKAACKERFHLYYKKAAWAFLRPVDVFG